MIQNGLFQSIPVSIHSIASSESIEWTYFESVSVWNIGSRHVSRFELCVEFPSILWLFVKRLCLPPHPLHTANHHLHHNHIVLWSVSKDDRGRHGLQVCVGTAQCCDIHRVQGLYICTRILVVLTITTEDLVRFEFICYFEITMNL